MKYKFLFSGILILCSTIITAQTVYQLPNPGFEQWDGGKTSEPTHWNTFESSDGSYSALASDNHHYRRPGGRPGSNGSYYLTIYTKSIAGVKANGNMTTGRIHAGSTSASSSNNYNYTQRSNSNHCQPFAATPDSMCVWVSFYANKDNSTAQIKAIIHGDNDFKSSNDEGDISKYAGYAVLETTRTTSSSTQPSWLMMKVPFVYDGIADPTYILVNITTNKIPGGGDKNDSLSVDDIEFIYSAWLTDISIDGVSMENFNKGHFLYMVHVDDMSSFGTESVGYTTEVEDATVVKSLETIDDTTACVTLTVTAEDGTTQKVYRILATTGILPELSLPDSPHPISRLVFPNPANDFLTINCDGLVELIDMNGHMVIHKQCSQGERIATSHLPKGLYTVIINGRKERIVIL